MTKLNESTVEDAALEYFAQLGYQTAWGPNLAPGEPGEERRSFGQVYLQSRLHSAVRRINPGIDGELVDEAIKRLGRAESQNPVAENFRVHKLLTEGVPVEHRGADEAVRTIRIWLIDYDEPSNNDWVAINQFSIIENGKNRRPDVIVFVNGIPVGLLELKNPTDEHATLKGAWNQLQTYRHDIPSLFTPNAVAVISDGTTAAMSSFTGGFEHFAPWKTVDGREVVTNLPALEVLIKGIFDQRRFLDIVRNFVVFSEETVTEKKTAQRIKALIKRVTKYHQYWAPRRAFRPCRRRRRYPT